MKSHSFDEIENYIISRGSDHVPTFGGKFEGGIQVQQVADEIAGFFKYMLDNNIKIESYLEIGVAAGGTTWLINHYLKPKRIVLIDDNKHPKAHIRKFILTSVKREEIIGNSHNPITKKSLSGIFDLILIDGDHTYEGIKADINNYIPFLNSGGFLFLHDSVLRPGIKRMVSELKEKMIFINEWVSKKHPCGIALFKNENI